MPYVNKKTKKKKENNIFSRKQQQILSLELNKLLKLKLN